MGSRLSAFITELRRRRVFRVGALVIFLLAFGSWAQAQDVLYDHSDAADVTIRSEVVGAKRLTVNLYYPLYAPDEPLPVVVFVLAYPDTVFSRPLKDFRFYTSWARLIAAEGFVGVLYETSTPESDLATVLDYLSEKAGSLRIDPNRLGLWSCSANTALALKHARTQDGVKPAAFVAYYGFMPTPDGFQAAAFDSLSKRRRFALPEYRNGESYHTNLPMLLVRAGRDRWSIGLNSIEHFTTYALKQNLPVTVINYPDGQHSFDVKDDTAETRAIIKQTLDFLRTHLGG